MNIEFIHLETLEDRLSIYPLYQQLNPRLSKDLFTERMTMMMNEHGYRLLACVSNNELVAIAGYWIAHKLYCGRYLEPDNVVTDENFRGQGIGEKLQNELERIARDHGCNVMMLDAYLENSDGHRFYERHGYHRKGFHFIKKIR